MARSIHTRLAFTRGPTSTHLLILSRRGNSFQIFPSTGFCGKAVVLDVRGQKKIYYNIVDHITKYIDTIVLLHTGYSKNWQSQDYYSSFPTVSEELARDLVRAKIKMIGIDGPSVDLDEGPFAVHRIFLGSGIPILENLCNLDVLQEKDFTLFSFPLSVATDGIPLRVVAEMQ